MRERTQVEALTDTSLSAIRRTGAVQAVHGRIALAIDLGLLRPGEKLPSADDTAAGLDVSRATVRRALVALERDGRVVRRPGRHGGTFVAEHPATPEVPAAAAYAADAQRVHRLIDERCVLEAGLAFVAAAEPSPEVLAELGELVRRMDTATDWTGFHRADVAFHRGVARAAGLPAVLDLHERITGELYSYFLPYPIEYLRGSNAEHAALVAALAAHDRAGAAELARSHVAELHDSMYVGLTS